MIKKCKIVIFSDLHYMPEDRRTGEDKKLTYYAEDILKKLINKVNNEIKPDFVVNLGDLIENIGDNTEDKSNYKYIYNKFNNFSCPVYSITGNHDLEIVDSREELEELIDYKNFTYSFDFNGFHFVFLSLDKNEKSETRSISNNDISWLKKDLDKNKLPCVIFNHFGIAEDVMKNHWYFSDKSEEALLENRKEIKQIINNNTNILAVFSGHQHWTKKLVEEDINYYILGSMTENINNDFIPDGVYFIVDLDQNNIKVTEHHISMK